MKQLAMPFLKYSLAGGIGFVVDYAVLFLLFVCCGIHYLCAAAIAFVAGGLCVYMNCNMWVFAHRRMAEKPHWELMIFLLVGVLGLVWTLAFMGLFVSLLGWHPMIAKLVTTAMVLFWNFFVRKLLLY